MVVLVLAPLIALAVVGGAALALQLQRNRQHALVGHVVDTGTTTSAPPATDPSILYFTGENCSVCHVAQRPALLSLADRLGGAVSIREIDVADDPTLTRRYRVLTLPTTIVLRPDSTVAAINTGFAPADRLQRQLFEAGLSIPEAGIAEAAAL